jgi:YidC/Oxa1 family membrane protein insertase
VTRRVELPKHPIADLKKADPERLRHDVQVHTAVENLSDEPQDMVLSFLGPVGLKREDLRADQRRLIVALGQIDDPDFQKRERPKVFEASGKTDKISGGDDLLPFLYGTVADKFFYTIVAPIPPAGGEKNPFGIVDAIVLTNNDANTASEVSQRGDLTFRFTSDVLTVLPKSSRHLSLDCFLGPKSRAAFNKLSPYKDRHYAYLIEAEYYWCAPVGLSNVMISLFRWIHSIPPHNYGIAIIVLVLIVRTLLHPITKKTQVNMVKMQENMAVLQPKIEEVKKKYANDKQKLQQATMEVYRESGINPANNILGCLPMFLQMPVWGALWTALSFTTEMRHEGFIFWIRDLTAPDALIPFGTTYNIPLMGPTSSFNLLPLFLGLSMYLQQKFMPKASRQAKKDRMSDDQLAQQEQMQKMMLIIMPIMMTVLFYNAPSGLTLYIMASSFFGMIEQWRIRQHIKEKKEQEEDDKGKKGHSAIKKPRFLKKLERLAEEAKQQRGNRTKPGKRKNPRPDASR